MDILNLALSGILMGIILMTQFISYPLLKSIPKDAFTDYHATYTGFIAPLVGPLMVFELIVISILTFQDPTNTIHIASAVLVIMIWLSTFLIQVPLHNKLAKAYHAGRINSLIHSNWIRTLGWSIKFALALYSL
ncbi:MAG: hypothetical protein L7U70_05680 [Flavobacteriales bacterium]|nr:hypothetical protein [Flavobacteriales bacterium]